MSSPEKHCTLRNLSNGISNCEETCKLRKIAGFSDIGEKSIGVPCEVLSEDLDSIRIRMLKLSDEKLAIAIEDRTSNEYLLLRSAFLKYYNEE